MECVHGGAGVGGTLLKSPPYLVSPHQPPNTHRAAHPPHHSRHEDITMYNSSAEIYSLPPCFLWGQIQTAHPHIQNHCIRLPAHLFIPFPPSCLHARIRALFAHPPHICTRYAFCLDLSLSTCLPGRLSLSHSAPA